MLSEKKRLVKTAQKLENNKPVSPNELATLLEFEKTEQESRVVTVLKQIGIPLSLILGFLLVVFSGQFERFVAQMPGWTNLSPQVLSGVDYLWNIIGEPVGRANILYHVPNIVLYAFGILGIKKLIDAINKKSWLDRVFAAKTLAEEKLTHGTLSYRLTKGHSLLFVGNGDFIGMQFSLNHNKNETITISKTKPLYTNIWNYYDIGLYEDLKEVIKRSDGEHAGEYMFFPVKDDQIFLPGPRAYDLSPHMLDIICQDVRMIEKELKLKPKRIIIIGDKFHKSFVQSEDHARAIPKSGDSITLESIAKKYIKVSIIDPTDVVLTEVLRISKGRKINFRATREGIQEYKDRFYKRLKLLGYKSSQTKRGVLTIGYDLFEDQTEQQTLARKINEYYPVVLSKRIRDALIRNGYRDQEFLYVPDLVLSTLSTAAARQ